MVELQRKSGILKTTAEMFLGLNSEVSKNVDRKNMRRIEEKRIKRKTNKGEDITGSEDGSNSWLSYLNPLAYLRYRRT